MLIYLIMILGSSGFLMGNIEFDIKPDNSIVFTGTYTFQGMGKFPVMMNLPKNIEKLEVTIDEQPVKYLPFGNSGLRFFLELKHYTDFKVKYTLKSEDKNFSLQLAPFHNFKGKVGFTKIKFTFPENFEIQCNFNPDEILQYNDKNEVCIILEDFAPTTPLQINW